MALQRCNEARGGIGAAADSREEGVAIRSRQHHALMLVEEPACALIGKIAGGKTGDRHGLLDHLLCRGCQPQFEPLRFVFSLRRCLLFSRCGRHVSKCGRVGRSLSMFVRQFAVPGKNAGIKRKLQSRKSVWTGARGEPKLRKQLIVRRKDFPPDFFAYPQLYPQRIERGTVRGIDDRSTVMEAASLSASGTVSGRPPDWPTWPADAASGSVSTGPGVGLLEPPLKALFSGNRGFGRTKCSSYVLFRIFFLTSCDSYSRG
jgi:hypothetical protein